MTHNSVLDLFICVVLQVQLGALVSYSYRRLDVRGLRDAALFVFLAASSVANIYGTQFFLFQLLPKSLDLFLGFSIASLLVVSCLFVGHLIDRSPSRFRWWD